MIVASSHIHDDGLSVLHRLVGQRVLVAISKGSARESGIWFDSGLIKFYPDTLRHRTVHAVPISGQFNQADKESDCWIEFVIRKARKAAFKRPKFFHFLAGSTRPVSQVKIFDEVVELARGKSLECDARIEIHFKDDYLSGLKLADWGWDTSG
jgi:hypothetical protein